MEHRITTGAIFAAMGSLWRGAPLPIAMTFAAILFSWLAADLLFPADSLLNATVTMVALILIIVLQYQLIFTLLRSIGALPETRRPGTVLSFIGVNIIAGILIALGFLCLIVPGIYLTARWWIVNALVIGEGRDTNGAMAASAECTADAILPIVGVLLLLSVPGLAGQIILLAPGFGIDIPQEIAWVIAGEILYAFSQTAMFTSTVAVYALTRPD